ncbi:MAG: hypothetical protein EPN91_06335 [Salinibacterium sp.]|nr:MAG: hypothetical protein EPN91_06335 [Salinibacterium sp.]
MTVVDKMLAQVERFQVEVLGFPVPRTVTRLDAKEVDALRDHIHEEVTELWTADTVSEQADALLDTVYICLGRLIRMGICPGPAFDEVHDANMRKQRGRVAKRPNEGWDAVKPPGWRAPDLEPYLGLTREDLLRAVILRDAPQTPVEKLREAGIEVRFTEPERKVGKDPALAAPYGKGVGTIKLDSAKAPVWRGVINYFPRGLYGVAWISAFGAEKYKEWGGFVSVENAVPRYSDALVRHQLDEAIGDPLPEADARLMELVRQQFPDATPRLVHAFQEAWNALARVELMMQNHDY